MTLERGTLVNNRYRIVEILGQGGMGAVYRAVDENLGVDVAVKENLFTTEEYARQFRREAVILATLRHPNLTRVTDHFVIEGQGQYLVMDYIEGEDLRQRMDRVGTLSEEEAIIIGIAVCDALSYLESRNPPIIHRDIKPGNVKITPNGQIFLVDFGLAKIVQAGQATTTGARAMTPGYSPPEQYGTARTDHRSDLFSLGATIYAAISGAIPEDALARAMDQAELTGLRKHNPKISRRMAAVIEKSLGVRPDDRYQTAQEFKQALLSVRNIARRNTGDYKIDPPPFLPDKPAPYSSNELNSEPLSISMGGDGNGGTALPFPSSSPLPALPPSARVKRRRGNRWVIFAVVVAILGLMTLITWIYFPTFPAQAIALIFPSPTPTATDAVIAMQTDAAQIALPTARATEQAAPTETSAPTPSATPDSSPTAEVIPDTPTPSLVPTPKGGGSGQVAFASDRTGIPQIYIINADGTGIKKLTDRPEGACQPDWSPDGMVLVFISPCERNQEEYPGSGIFLINADGSGETQLTLEPGGDFDPAWSPDGKSIAFTSLRNSGRPRIYVLDVDTGEVTRLSEQYSYDRQPAWSRDSQTMAFVTSQKGPIQVWTMNRDGSEQQLFSRSGDAVNTHPDWAVDGETILFTQVKTPGGIPGVVSASTKDGEYTEFMYGNAATPAREGKYSPDGLWLVFESWPEGLNHDIYIMTISNTDLFALTTDERFDFDPVWRPAALQE